MPINLTSTDLFGLNPIQQDSLKKIVAYVEAVSDAGSSEFPYIPHDMFFGFDNFEAKSLTAMLYWAWSNPNSDSPMPAYLMPYGFGDGEEKGLTKLSRAITDAGVGGGFWYESAPISFGALGDSITRNQYTPSTAWSAQVGTVINWTGRAWGPWACQRSGRRTWANIYAFEGNSGWTTAQLLAGMLPASNTFAIGVAGNTANVPYGVLACRPRYCFVMAGTNDLKDGVPLATCVANLRLIWAALRSGGVEPIAISLLPQDAPQTNAALVPTWNAAIEAAAGDEGVHFIDVYTNCNNGSGGFKTGWTYINGVADPTGLHPGNEAAQSMAEDIAASLATFLPASVDTPYVNSATTYISADATRNEERALHSSLGGGIFPSATGWGSRFETGGTSSVAVSAGGVAELGNKLAITLPAPAAGADLYSDRNGPTSYTVVPGRKYGIMARVKFTATHAEDTCAFGIQGPATAATLWIALNINSRTASTAAGASMAERDIYHEFVVPPGMTTIRPWLQATAKLGGAGCVLEVAHLGLREVA